MIPEGEKPDTFAGLTLAPYEGRTLKGCDLKDDFLPWRATTPSCSLVSEVSRALDDEVFRDQWVQRTKNGAIGAAQFLAVILWAFCGEKPDAETDSLIVNGWAARLLDATRLRVAVLGLQGPHREVTPFDPITFLELREPLKDWLWVLTVDNADDFLIDRSIGFKCSDVLAYWRGEESPYTARPMHNLEAIAKLASPLAATSGAETIVWTESRKDEARAMANKLRSSGVRNFNKRTAEYYGVSPQRLAIVLKGKNKAKQQNSVFSFSSKTQRGK